ncbi:MAG: 4Fe-4S dicluster domain-containing protein [Candidatus Eremiobacteraeota bacterium]|nr:4Fe-4S dicluster domain-containing protein [Candidatus Eremiobacteraeota bacterium]
MITLTIDDREVEVEEGTTILEAARALDIEIPTLCYNKALAPYGACRMCIVEIHDGNKVMIESSCTYPAREGLKVYTASPKIIKNRKMLAELHLARCPEVEEVRKIAESLGVTDTRIRKRYEDCTLCGLCVRMCMEKMGPAAIGFINRGHKRIVGTPYDKFSEVCQTCGACESICPANAIKLEEVTTNMPVPIPFEFEQGLVSRHPIYIPFPQAVPNKPVIDRDTCIHYLTGGCGICESFCEANAIRYDQEDEIKELDVGAIILATGFNLFDASQMVRYGYGKFPNVWSSLEFERYSHASGPTSGEIVLADGRKPESVAIIHCVGSRDSEYHSYCSRVCCMYAMKFAHLVKEKTNAKVYEFYIDIRAFGKGYEEFYDRMLEEDVEFIRGKVAEVTDFAETEEEKGKLIVCAEDTLLGFSRRIPVDLVILCNALSPQPDTEEVARLFSLSRSKDGFFLERHPKLAPVSTANDGVYIAGACQGPKDIPDSVAQGNAAAAEALALIDKGVVQIEPIIGKIDEEICSGCRVCNDLCPYDAIEFDEEKHVSRIIEAMCKGCGTCAAACPSGCIVPQHFTDEAIMAEIEGVLVES